MTKEILLNHIEEFLADTKSYGISLKLIYSFDNEFYSNVPALDEKFLKPKLLKDFISVITATFSTKSEDNDFELVHANKGEATDRRTIYHISQSKIPVANNIFNAPDLELNTEYQFKKQELSSIWGIVVTIGNSEKSISLFKKNYNVNVIKKTSTYQLFFESGALKIFNDDLLKLSHKFDVAIIKNELIIINKAEFEKHFEYVAAMESEANKKIDTIISSKLVDDSTKIYDLIKNKRTLKKILNIDENNPIFKTEPKKLASFAKKYKLDIELTEDKSKISIPNKKSAEVFVKLLNDDYLISELTKSLYDSRGKKKI